MQTAEQRTQPTSGGFIKKKISSDRSRQELNQELRARNAEVKEVRNELRAKSGGGRRQTEDLLYSPTQPVDAAISSPEPSKLNSPSINPSHNYLDDIVLVSSQRHDDKENQQHGMEKERLHIVDQTGDWTDGQKRSERRKERKRNRGVRLVSRESNKSRRSRRDGGGTLAFQTVRRELNSEDETFEQQLKRSLLEDLGKQYQAYQQELASSKRVAARHQMLMDQSALQHGSSQKGNGGAFEPASTDILVMILLNALLCCIFMSVLVYFLRQRLEDRKQQVKITPQVQSAAKGQVPSLELPPKRQMVSTASQPLNTIRETQSESMCSNQGYAKNFPGFRGQEQGVQELQRVSKLNQLDRSVGALDTNRPLNHQVETQRSIGAIRTQQSEQEMMEFPVTKGDNSLLSSSEMDDEPKTKTALIGQQRTTRKEMTDAFKFIDKDGTGSITFENLKLLVRQLGADFTDDDIRDMMKEADTDGSGEIDIKEFLKVMRRTEVLHSSTPSPCQPTPDELFDRSPAISRNSKQNDSSNGLNNSKDGGNNCNLDVSLESGLSTSK